MRFDLETAASPDQARRAFTDSSYGGGGEGLVRITAREGGGSHVQAEWTSTRVRGQRFLILLVHHAPLNRVISRQWSSILDRFSDADSS